jgi:hypothetical protein
LGAATAWDWLMKETSVGWRKHCTPSSRPSPPGERGVLDDVRLFGGLGAAAAWGGRAARRGLHALPANGLALRTDLERCGSEFDSTLTTLGTPRGTAAPGCPEDGWHRQVEFCISEGCPIIRPSRRDENAMGNISNVGLKPFPWVEIHGFRQWSLRDRESHVRTWSPSPRLRNALACF